MIDGRRYSQAIHILVARTFVENSSNKPFVNHKDLNKQNNHFENLEWVTPSENVMHWYNATEGKNQVGSEAANDNVVTDDGDIDGNREIGNIEIDDNIDEENENLGAVAEGDISSDVSRTAIRNAMYARAAEAIKEARLNKGWIPKSVAGSRDVIDTDDYMRMTVTNLQKLAKERGLKGYSNTNKPTLVAMLQNDEDGRKFTNAHDVDNPAHYIRLTAKQLRAIARRRGLVGYTHISKPRLITMLQETFADRYNIITEEVVVDNTVYTDGYDQMNLDQLRELARKRNLKGRAHATMAVAIAMLRDDDKEKNNPSGEINYTKLSRDQLRTLAKNSGLTHYSNLSIPELIKLLQESRVVKIKGPPKIKEAYTAMTLAELRTLATERNIKGRSDRRKADLIELLINDDNSN